MSSIHERLGFMSDEALNTATLGQIQEEQMKWSQYNFGAQPSYRPLLGMIEELCELDDALCAIQVDGKEPVKDAIGDITIYMLDFCGRRGKSIQGPWEAKASEGPFDLTKLIRRLAHHQLKGEQNIRGGTAHHEEKIDEALADILECLRGIARRGLKTDFMGIARDVWRSVRRRDWQQQPNTAHTAVEPTNA